MRHVPAALVNRYAKALFGVALGQNALAAVRADLQSISETWKGDPELALMLLNPGLSREKVRAILMAVADRIKASVITRHFLELLLDKERLEVLYDVGARFEQLCRDHEGEVLVRVATAIPVGEELRANIQGILARQSGRKPLITWQQQPDLLGGIVVEWPDRIFDGSLARKLENLRDYLAQGA